MAADLVGRSLCRRRGFCVGRRGVSSAGQGRAVRRLTSGRSPRHGGGAVAVIVFTACWGWLWSMLMAGDRSVQRVSRRRRRRPRRSREGRSVDSGCSLPRDHRLARAHFTSLAVQRRCSSTWGRGAKRSSPGGRWQGAAYCCYFL